jgi:hypothetical protein
VSFREDEQGAIIGGVKRLACILLVLAACGDDTGPPDAVGLDAPAVAGSLSLTWTIADGPTALACDDIGAITVTLSIRPENQPFGSTEVLPCGAGQGSVDLPPNTYIVDVSLGGVDLEPIKFVDVVVNSEQDTSLGEVAFEVATVGGFSFTMSAAGGNCTGAGITAVELALSAQGGGCVPATFELEGGGTYATDCASPQPHPACIDSDVTVTAQPTITTGPYRLDIRGLVGGTPCWTKAAQFDVPAAGAIRALPNQTLIHDDLTPACNP